MAVGEEMSEAKCNCPALDGAGFCVCGGIATDGTRANLRELASKIEGTLDDEQIRAEMRGYSEELSEWRAKLQAKDAEIAALQTQLAASQQVRATLEEIVGSTREYLDIEADPDVTIREALDAKADRHVAAFDKLHNRAASLEVVLTGLAAEARHHLATGASSLASVIEKAERAVSGSTSAPILQRIAALEAAAKPFSAAYHSADEIGDPTKARLRIMDKTDLMHWQHLADALNGGTSALDGAVAKAKDEETARVNGLMTTGHWRLMTDSWVTTLEQLLAKARAEGAAEVYRKLATEAVERGESQYVVDQYEAKAAAALRGGA